MNIPTSSNIDKQEHLVIGKTVFDTLHIFIFYVDIPYTFSGKSNINFTVDTEVHG